MTLLTRRSLLWGLVAAPAIVKAASIMPVKVFDLEVLDPEILALEEDALALRGMPFTAAEIQNIANASLDFYLYEADSFRQIQARPNWERLSAVKKIFPGGNGRIELAVARPWRV